MRHGRAASGVNGEVCWGRLLQKLHPAMEVLEPASRFCWKRATAGVGTPTISATFPPPLVLESSNTGAGTGHYGCYNPPSQMLEPATVGATSCRRRCWNMQREELQPAISFATNGTTVCWNGPTVLLQPARGTATTANCDAEFAATSKLEAGTDGIFLLHRRSGAGATTGVAPRLLQPATVKASTGIEKSFNYGKKLQPV